MGPDNDAADPFSLPCWRHLVPPAQNPKVTEARKFNGFGTNFEGNPEPIYGPLFLPRKFKVAVTGAPGCLPCPVCPALPPAPFCS